MKPPFSSSPNPFDWCSSRSNTGHFKVNRAQIVGFFKASSLMVHSANKSMKHSYFFIFHRVKQSNREQHFGTLPRLKPITLFENEENTVTAQRQAFNNLVAVTNTRCDAGLVSKGAVFNASLPGTAIYSAYRDGHEHTMLISYRNNTTGCFGH